MKQARYGRMHLGRCLGREHYGYMGCSANVLSLLNSRCSGRQTCQISVSDATFADIHPCPSHLESFLEVSYDCATGMAKEHTTMCHSFLSVIRQVTSWLASRQDVL